MASDGRQRKEAENLSIGFDFSCAHFTGPSSARLLLLRSNLMAFYPERLIASKKWFDACRISREEKNFFLSFRVLKTQCLVLCRLVKGEKETESTTPASVRGNNNEKIKIGATNYGNGRMAERRRKTSRAINARNDRFLRRMPFCLRFSATCFSSCSVVV